MTDLTEFTDTAPRGGATGEGRQERDTGGTTAVTGRHLPALNGLRGVAVVVVVAYHLQLGWASGGYLGVDLFFVLSGFLITTLLLEEWVGSGRIDLVAFWGRRARRLLPALFLVVAALAVYLHLQRRLRRAGRQRPGRPVGLRGEAIGTLLYVNNWHLIFAHQSYFAQFSTPSPLQHTWSLAIEEQFYLVWPLVLLLLLHCRHAAAWRTGRGVASRLALGGWLSTVLMAVLFHPGVDPSRVYYGTDTRLFDLMAGADASRSSRRRGRSPVRGPGARSTSWPRWPGSCSPCSGSPRARPAGCPRTTCSRAASCVCAALAAARGGRRPAARAGAVLPRRWPGRPLHFIGTISYGIYLWHWPVIVYITRVADRAVDRAARPRAGRASTLALSTASYYLVERPIRLARLRGWVRAWVAPSPVWRRRCSSWSPPSRPWRTRPGWRARRTPADHPGRQGPGAGGFPGSSRSAWPRRPRRRIRSGSCILGDSVMHDASYGITAALAATGEVERRHDTDRRLRSHDRDGLARSFPEVIRLNKPQLIVATWSWDQYGPTTPERAPSTGPVPAPAPPCGRHLLTPGNGVEGVIFTAVPQGRQRPAARTPAQHPTSRTRAAGVVAWNRHRREHDTAIPGPGHVLPVGGRSLLWHGQYSAWLPAGNDPHVPLDQWIRVRKLDRVHLCAEGAARFADALLADMTALFKLAPADPAWIQGSWTGYSDYNDPPGSCPDDHPPSG